MTTEPKSSVRAFFALPISDGVRDALIDAQARMKRAAPPHLALRWSRAEQLHVTLKFLGDVERTQLAELSAIAERRAAQCSALELRVSTLIAFGKPARARALVAEIEANPQLSELATRLEDDAFALGIAREARVFRPHVTLARFTRPGVARPLIEAGALEPLIIPCAELRLYESALTAEGGRYTVLRACALSAERQA